jgi:uncharacterized protein (DUF2384 family)
MSKVEDRSGKTRWRGARKAAHGELTYFQGYDGPSIIDNTWGAAHASEASSFVTQFMDARGLVDVDRVADAFRMSKGQLAETTGLATATLSKSDRRVSAKAQIRMTETLEIISRLRKWAGGEARAMAWYRSQPIPALDGRTPEALVKDGRARAVRDYLDHLALGGFA